MCRLIQAFCCSVCQKYLRISSTVIIVYKSEARVKQLKVTKHFKKEFGVICAINEYLGIAR